MHTGLITLIVALITLCSGAAPATAGATQDLDRITTAAQAWVESSAGRDAIVHAGPLDPRLRLTACLQPLEPFSPNGMGVIASVGIRCPGPNAWTIYVPIKVSRYAEVAVTTRPLARGSALTAADLRVERRELGLAAAPAYDAQRLPIGHQLRQPLAAGTMLGPQHLLPLLVVRRGSQVQLAASVAGIAVRMQGQALSDAVAGDRVKVRNLTSKRVVEGIARSDGVIEILL